MRIKEGEERREEEEDMLIYLRDKKREWLLGEGQGKGCKGEREGMKRGHTEEKRDGKGREGGGGGERGGRWRERGMGMGVYMSALPERRTGME